MNQSDRFARGADGERRVAEILESLRPTYGYGLINDILLDFNGKTTQIDHVLIDQFGILVIETKTYGALLRGKSDEGDWTACYPSGQHRKMLNPLLQNDGHRKWLHKLLFQYGRGLCDKYVQSLIVFADGEIDGLDLSGVDKLRVVKLSKVEEYVRTRQDFQPNEGQLGQDAQRDLCDFVFSMDKSGDPEAEARHLASVQEAKSRHSRNRSRGTAPSRPRMRRTTQPAAERRRRGKDVQGADAVWFGLLLFAFVLITSCGRSCATAPIPAPAAGTTPSIAQPLAIAYDVNLVLEKVRQADPSVVKRFANPKSPRLTTTRGLPTYMWSYVAKGSRGNASIHLYSVTLDAGGNIVGVDAR